MQQPLPQTSQRTHRRILRQRRDIGAAIILRHPDQDLDVPVLERVVLRLHQFAQLFFAHGGFGERDVLPPYEAAACGLVDRPGQVRGCEDEDAGRVAFAGGVAARGCFLQVGPLDQEFRLDSARGFVLAAATAGAQEGVDFVDEDDAGCKRFGEREQRAHEFLAFTEVFGGEAAGADGEEDASALCGDGAREHRFACPGRSEEEHSSRRLAEAHEQVGTEERVDHCFFQSGFGDFEARDVVPVDFVALDDDFV